MSNSLGKNKSLDKVLKRYRERAGWSRSELAEAVSIPKSLIDEWETRGVKSSSYVWWKELVAVAAALSLELDEAVELLESAGLPPIEDLWQIAGSASEIFKSWLPLLPDRNPSFGDLLDIYMATTWYGSLRLSNETGIPKQNITNWRKKISTPRVDEELTILQLIALATTFRLDIDDATFLLNSLRLPSIEALWDLHEDYRALLKPWHDSIQLGKTGLGNQQQATEQSILKVDSYFRGRDGEIAHIANR
jgi:transcriptional regulator with XRE-family HTH domain